VVPISTLVKVRDPSKLVEGLFEVGDDVVRVLYADGESHEVLPDPEPLAARG
jgi:hypothetical protein